MGDGMTGSNWYYHKPGGAAEDHLGPLTWEEMVANAQHGTLSPDDLVWHEQLGDWRPAAEVAELFTVMPPPPPPPSAYDVQPAPPPPPPPEYAPQDGYGAQPAYAAAPGYAHGPAPKRRSPWIWIGPLIAIVVIAAALGGYFGLRGSGETDTTDETGGEVFVQQEGEILLEPAGSAGPESFAEEMFVPTGPTSTLNIPTSTTAAAQTPATTQSGDGAQVAVVSFPGDTPALYGGSKDQQVADKEGQLSFLAENPDKAAAFCEALNNDPTLRWSGGSTVQIDQLPAYFDELTPVLLTRDIRVTNHGYRDGHPTPRQSVLQAGQLVLVDSYGVPRVRCECGNPLIPPQPVSKTPTYTGPRWPGFDPTTIIVIQQTNVIIENFVLIDIHTGDIFVRPAGTDGSQDGSAPTTSTSEATTTTAPSTTTTSGTTGPGGPVAGDELNGLWSGTMTITNLDMSDEAAQAAESEGCSVALLDALLGQALPMTMEITVDAGGTSGTAVMIIDPSALDPEGQAGLTSEPETLFFTIQGDTLVFNMSDSSAPTSMVGVVSRVGTDLVMKGTFSSGAPTLFSIDAEWELMK